MMEPFSDARPSHCPKCLFTAPGRAVVPTHGWGLQFVDAESGTTETGRDWFVPEHLLITCACCGWSYQMQPADMAPMTP